MIRCDMIYLLTSIRVTPGGSSTVHIYTQTIHRTTQLTTRTTQTTTNWEECGPCPVYARYTLAFALQLRKKYGKTSVRVVGECQLARWKQNIQNRAHITIRIHKHNIEESIRTNVELTGYSFRRLSVWNRRYSHVVLRYGAKNRVIAFKVFGWRETKMKGFHRLTTAHCKNTATRIWGT